MSQPPASNSTAKSSIATPLLICLVSRAGLFLLAYLGLAMLPGARSTHPALPGNLFLDGWTRWDGDWYTRIAVNGYTNQAIDDSGQRDTVFFPLYPLLIRGVTLVIGDPYISGILISNLAFVVAGAMLYRLIEQRWDARVAQRTLILLCIFPFSYTFSAVYTEGVFLMLVVFAFWFAEKQQWLAAACFAAAAGATRSAGVLVPITLVFVFLSSVGWNVKRALEQKRQMFLLPLGFTGLVAFVVYLWIRFNEPLAFLNSFAAKGWGDWNSRKTLLATLGFWTRGDFDGLMSGNAPLLLTLHLILCVVAATLCILAWKKLPMHYAAWATMSVLFSYLAWGCFGRHMASCFPLFIVSALLLESRPGLFSGLAYLSILLLALLTLMFTHGQWVA